MWVTSSAVQQNVLVSQNAGEEWQDAASQEAASMSTWLQLLSLHLAQAPRADPPLGQGEPEKTVRAGAHSSEGKQGDLDTKNYSIHTVKIPICY